MKNMGMECCRLRYFWILTYYCILLSTQSVSLENSAKKFFFRKTAISFQTLQSIFSLKYIFTKASPDGRCKTMRWLQARGLLATQMSCTCAGNMYLTERKLNRGNKDDKWAWMCPEYTSVQSIRSGSWFEGECWHDVATYQYELSSSCST